MKIKCNSSHYGAAGKSMVEWHQKSKQLACNKFRENSLFPIVREDWKIQGQLLILVKKNYVLTPIDIYIEIIHIN